MHAWGVCLDTRHEWRVAVVQQGEDLLATCRGVRLSCLGPILAHPSIPLPVGPYTLALPLSTVAVARFPPPG